MNAATVNPGLVVIEDQRVVLQNVSVKAKLRDLLEEVTISQTYKNYEDKNIEAIYTFPLPVDGVLLDLSVKIGERTLRGAVVEKKEAEDRYEDAVVEGDMAIMLEQIESGLYTANIGNLLPGEEIAVSFTYALLHKWTGNTLRFYLPSTVSPRYGEPALSHLEPHQYPEIDMLAENRVSFHMSVSGLIKDAFIESPTHKVTIKKNETETDILLAGEDTMMDRDFVLNFTVEAKDRNAVVLGRDTDERYTLLASFSPSFPQKTDSKSRSIKVVVDCSGSMGGDSITQARKAVEMIIDSLRPQDYFNIITFGSNYKIVFERQVPASPENCAAAKKYNSSLNADMGGTELGKALQAAFKIPGCDHISDNVLLITDGEIWGAENLSNQASVSGHRIFTVGVGNAVSEVTVRQLAERTGGAAEMVTPNEQMAAKIFRHFKRIYAPAAHDVRVVFPGTPVHVFPGSIDSIFDGDTVHAFAVYASIPKGNAVLKAQLENGEIIEQYAPAAGAEKSEHTDTAMPGTLARLRADRLVRTADAETAVGTAVTYQLMSKYTNYLIVDVREDDKKANDLPDNVKVPNMLSAGWGGTGAVCYSIERNDFVFEKLEMYERDSQVFYDLDIEAGTFQRYLEEVLSTGCHVTSVDDLQKNGLDAVPAAALRKLIESGFEEQSVVWMFINLYIETFLEDSFSRFETRIIKKRVSSIYNADLLKERILAVIAKIEE